MAINREYPGIDETRLRYVKPETRFDRRKILNAIVDQLGWMSDLDCLGLVVLLRHADKTGKSSPGNNQIAAALGVNRGQVGQMLARLVDCGVITLVRAADPPSRKAAEYWFRPPFEWPTKPPVAEDC